MNNIDEIVRALRDAEGNNELDCEISELRPLLLKTAALIESLQTQLSASQRREKAAVEDIRQACGNCAHSGNPSCPWEGTYHHRGPSGEKIGVCNTWEWRGPHTEEYTRIHAEVETWPQWKIDAYNNCIATSAHAKKIQPENEPFVRCGECIVPIADCPCGDVVMLKTDFCSYGKRKPERSEG